MIRYLTHQQSQGLRFTRYGSAGPHRADVSYIGQLCDANTVFEVIAALEEFHHEARSWAETVEKMNGDAYIVRPRGWDGSCPCNRCVQGWTDSAGRDQSTDPAR